MMTSETFAEKKSYWESFYKSQEPKRFAAPSQFAAFVSQEAGDSLIIEVGCGGGRDSLFFARQGLLVAAIDGSEAAIENCIKQRDDAGVTGVSFQCATVGSDDFLTTVRALRSAHAGQAFGYARFFLHAITEDEEKAFFQDMSEALMPGDRLALEYRTIRDASGAKVTAAHYRRYVNPSSVFANAGRLGFTVDYAVEGFGFAKYKHDDAYVARCILARG